jgi:hypothetical protein
MPEIGLSPVTRTAGEAREFGVARSDRIIADHSRHQAAAVDAVESTLRNTSVAFRISSIVPIEIRAWV